jgi:transposase-like protein
MRDKEQKEAKRLRKEFGYSIKEIAQELNVAKSSVSLWVRNIPLTEGQKEALEKRVKANQSVFVQRYSSRHLWGNTYVRAKHLKIRKKYQEEGRKIAGLKNPLFYMGCGLYWGEGSKCKNSVQMSNSDIDLIKIFLKFLRDFFDVKDETISLTINCYDNNGISVEKIETYWVDNLNLSKKCLRKTIVNKYSKFSARKKIGKLPYGTAKLAVHRTDILHKIYGAIQAIGGFEREKWLF